MPKKDFVGRRSELSILSSEWEANDARLMILYGRRRVGKTRLITHFIKTSNARALYWVAEPTSSTAQLRSFSRAVFNFEKDPARAADLPEDFSYGSWKVAFEEAGALARDKRLLLVLDEFTYLMTIEQGVAGTLQNAWDHRLKESNIFLIISGSHLGMMERGALSYQAPLYGRATSRLKLQPLPFKDTTAYFPTYKPDERVAAYALFGGIAQYWEQINPHDSVIENIKKVVLARGSLLFEEPRLLLQDFVSEIGNYAAILGAIAHGYRTPKEIEFATGLSKSHLSQYLSNLIDTGFVERRVPVTESHNSRLGRHYITDPFLRFYYRFLAERQSQLAMGVDAPALKEFRRHFIDFMGMYTWEELCREWLLRSTAYNIVPYMPNQVGSAWNREAQIDVAGINRMDKTLILGECKWGHGIMGADVLKKLVNSARILIPGDSSWSVYFIGFARDGWSPDAKKYAGSVQNGDIVGANWQATGMLLKTLAEVDKDLGDWTE